MLDHRRATAVGQTHTASRGQLGRHPADGRLHGADNNWFSCGGDAIERSPVQRMVFVDAARRRGHDSKHAGAEPGERRVRLRLSFEFRHLTSIPLERTRDRFFERVVFLDALRQRRVVR